MIPKQLIIEGIYSYQKRQIIDFSQLTDAGLFGIFGATGSGKSSILEAISFALYGETERLNARDKRSYNMMNLKSDKAFIALDFYNHENQLYRATREFKRNAKNFEDIRSPKVVFYKRNQNQWIPLEHNKAENIIGLSYANFKRTIIIPQGRFREFLELGPTERTRMMKDIFDLQRFDLQDKVSKLNRANQSELDRLEGRLQSFGKLDKAMLDKRKEAWETAHEHREKAKKEFEKQNQQYQVLKHLQADFKTLQEKQKSFADLEKEKPKIDRLEKDAQDYERYYNKFYQELVSLKKIKKEHQDELKKSHKILKDLKAIRSQIKEKANALEKISDYYKNLDDKKTESRDLEFITQIIEGRGSLKKLEGRLNKGKKQTKIAKEEKSEIQEKIRQHSKSISRQKTQKYDGKLIRDVAAWFYEYKSLAASGKEHKTTISQGQSELQILQKKMIGKGLDLKTFDQTYQEQLNQLETQKREREEVRDQLLVQQKLADHAHALHDGEACPLCGSEEHPHVVEAEDVSEELQRTTKILASIDHKKAKLYDQKTEIGKISERKKLMEERLSAEKKEYRRLTQKIEAHQKAFDWEDFDPDNLEGFRKKQKENDLLEKAIETAEKELQDLRKTQEKVDEKVEKYTQTLREIEKKEQQIQSNIESSENQLKRLNFEQYKSNSRAEVTDFLRALQEKNKQVENRYETLQKTLQQLTIKETSLETSCSNSEKRVEELDDRISDLQQDIDHKLTDENLTEIEEVRDVLKRDMDLPKERQKITNFRLEFGLLKKEVEGLKKKLEKVSFSEKRFREETTKWETAQNHLKEQETRVVSLETEIKRLTDDYKKKKALVKDLEKRQKRADNLKIMFNLFKGSGFVQYVSSIFLSQLCDYANVRFHRMTRNQLSLRLNEKNDFEIIDHLNEGRSRSVKTLSGGQSFQVSLSLALALAESVQANAKAKKNFFFIDEGFGTQDLESVNIIFETLVNLNRENKIVGIISHVEELKDRIPQSLSIEKDLQKGSLIYREGERN